MRSKQSSLRHESRRKINIQRDTLSCQRTRNTIEDPQIAISYISTNKLTSGIDLICCICQNSIKRINAILAYAPVRT